ncbi:MAG: four helix bundle protein [Salinibacter sp.]
MPTKSDVEMMDLNDLAVYRRSMKLAERIWAEVEDWPSFAKYSIGEQLVQAADSIAANISEGHGRYHFGENRQFCYYARGSLQETITWLQKAKMRGLITDECYEELSDELTEIRKMLNGYVRSIGTNANS